MRFTRHGRIGPLLRLLSVVVVSLTTGLFRRDWRHLDRVPARGPAILAVNHVSYADPFVMARFVWDAGRIPRFLGKAPLFTVPVIGTVLRGAGQIPVRRATTHAADALESAVDALHRGEIVVIYPEGTVTRDDAFWPMVAKTGVARLALLVPEAPLIPVAQWGAQDSVDWYHRRFRLFPRKQVTISVGPRVDTSAYRSAAGLSSNTASSNSDASDSGRSDTGRSDTGRSDTGRSDTGRSDTGRPVNEPDRSPTPQTLRALTDAVMTVVREELAGIRGLPAPTTFTARPPASVRKVSMPEALRPEAVTPEREAPGAAPELRAPSEPTDGGTR